MATELPGKTWPEPRPPGDEWVPAILEPKGKASDNDVISALLDLGARDVEILAPGFISALIFPESLDDLRAIAEVHPKVRKRMR